MTAIEIAAIAATMKSLARELGVSVDINQLASRVGLSRGVGMLGALPLVGGGVGLGFALGVLFAPRSGRETRQRLSQSTSRVIERMREMRKAASLRAEAEMLTPPAEGKGGGAAPKHGRWTGAAE